MSGKTIFIIVLTILVTIVLMKNTDEVIFWLFGDRYIPKLAILGTMFGSGLVIGFLLGRPRKVDPTTKVIDQKADYNAPYPSGNLNNQNAEKPYNSTLNDEDKKYLE